MGPREARRRSLHPPRREGQGLTPLSGLISQARSPLAGSDSVSLTCECCAAKEVLTSNRKMNSVSKKPGDQTQRLLSTRQPVLLLGTRPLTERPEGPGSPEARLSRDLGPSRPQVRTPAVLPLATALGQWRAQAAVDTEDPVGSQSPAPACGPAARFLLTCARSAPQRSPPELPW